MERTQTAADVFGERMRKLRTAKGWSQTVLGERMADQGSPMSPQTVAKLENGKRPTSVDDLLALARVFGCSISELVGPLDDVFGLGPSLVVQQLGQVEDRLKRLEEEIVQRTLAIVTDRVIAAIQGPAFKAALDMISVEDAAGELERDADV